MLLKENSLSPKRLSLIKLYLIRDLFEKKKNSFLFYFWLFCLAMIFVVCLPFFNWWMFNQASVFRANKNDKMNDNTLVTLSPVMHTFSYAMYSVFGEKKTCNQFCFCECKYLVVIIPLYPVQPSSTKIYS